MVSLYRSAVFLSHRRADTAAQARGLKDDLERAGVEVFLDVDGIDYGSSIRQTIDQAMGSTTLLLLLIGERWVETSLHGLPNRLWDPGDWVRLEVESAHAQSVPVRPVLVDRGVVPPLQTVPPSLWPALDMKALPLRNEDHVRDRESVVSFVDTVLEQRGLGARSVRLGRRTYTRGDAVRLDSVEGTFTKVVTGGDADVVWGRQVGRVLGVRKDAVLVRWDRQPWAPRVYGAGMQVPVFGRPVMLKKTELGPFDAWVLVKHLKPVRSSS